MDTNPRSRGDDGSRAVADAGGAASRPLDGAGLALVLLSTLVWSSQSIGIKFGLHGLPPYTLMATRLVLAVVVLLAIVAWKRPPFPSGSNIWTIGPLLGILQLAASGSLFFWALQYLPVGRANILIATQPFLTVLAAHYLIAGERMKVEKLVGLGFGFLGVVVLVASREGDLGSRTVWADLAVIAAATMWTASSLVVKRVAHRWHTLSLVTVQMAFAASIMVVVALLFDAETPKHFTPQSIGGILYLATVGSGGAFFLNYYVLRRHAVTVVNSFVFLQPVFGVLLGILILGERFTVAIGLSLILVTLGLTFVNRAKAARQPR